MTFLRSLANFPVYLRVDIIDGKRVPIGAPVPLWIFILAFAPTIVVPVSILTFKLGESMPDQAAFILWSAVPIFLTYLLLARKDSFLKVAKPGFDLLWNIWSAAGAAVILIGAATYLPQLKDGNFPDFKVILSWFDAGWLTFIAALAYLTAVGRIAVSLAELAISSCNAVKEWRARKGQS